MTIPSWKRSSSSTNVSTQRAGISIYTEVKIRGGVWAAYGYSAYTVAGMERCDDITIVKNYSKKVSMPVVIMGDATCKHIASRNHKEEQTADYIRLSMFEPRSADTDNYRDWARSLRDAIP